MKNLQEKFYLILILFIWLFPNHGVVDKIGSQWLYLSILNLGFLPIVFIKFYHKNVNFSWKSPPLISFFLFTVWAFISYFFAFNRIEVLIETFRLFTLLTTLILASYSIYTIKDKVGFISILLTVHLCIEVFYFLIPTLEIISQKTSIARSTVSKGISANINIASFSILYKTPFAFYLLLKANSKIVKGIIYLTIVSGIFSITILATRGALLGVIIIGLFYLIGAFYNKGYKLKRVVLNYIIPVLLAFSLNKIIISDGVDVSERISTISKLQEDSSIKNRFDYYLFSVKSFIDKPFTGFGYGNWKLESIPTFLNQRKTYILPYHSHNDFLQISAELGIIGLTCYLLFFLFLITEVFKNLRQKTDEFNFHFAILLFFVVYLIDANLNFPIARPIMQVPLLLITAFIISKSLFNNNMNDKGHNLIKTVLFSVFLLLQPVLLYSNARVFSSFKEQRKLLVDFNRRSFEGDLNEIDSYESEYPNIGVTGLPLKVMKALYFAKSDRKKAISLAKNSIIDNPYLFLPEAFLAEVYMGLNKKDSAFYFAKKAYLNAPTIDLHAANYYPFLSNSKDTIELRKVEEFLKKSDSPFIWSKYIETLLQLKDTLNQNEVNLIGLASKKFPETDFFKAIDLSKNYSKKNILKADSLAKIAEGNFKSKKYLLAIENYKRASTLAPFEPAYTENIARAYMLQEKYDMAILYFNQLIENHNIKNGLAEFYIGTIYIKIGESKKGCDYLFNSMEKNFSGAKNLYNRLCLKK